MNDKTLVSDVCDKIAFQIVSGKYMAGEQLPSVRKLAAEYGINPSTSQLVLKRLESLGFASSRPASGFTVKDIDQFGGITTWRYIFRFAQQIPDRAIRTCRELLEFRTFVVVQGLNRILENPGKYSTANLRKVVEQFEHISITDPENYFEISKLQVHALRHLYIATEQSVMTAVINSISEIYLDVPAFMKVMTANPAVHIQLWKFLLKEWEEETLTKEKVDFAEVGLKSQNQLLLKQFKDLVSDPGYAESL